MKLAAAIASACLAQLSFANLIVNGSFENGQFVPNSQNTMSLNPGATNITGWTIGVAEIAWISDPNPWLVASHGIKSLDLMGYHDSLPTGSVSQTVATAIGTRYRVVFDVGRQSEIIVQTNSSTESFLGNGASDPAWWSTKTHEFTAASSLTTISFRGGPSTLRTYAGIDSVSVEAVPEPSMLATLGLGVLAVWRKRRR